MTIKKKKNPVVSPNKAHMLRLQIKLTLLKLLASDCDKSRYDQNQDMIY